MTNWYYRPLEAIRDLRNVVDLEIATWGLDPKDAVPDSMMHAVAYAGGLIVGAYDSDRLIGMTLAFPSRKDGRWILWSHMAAVHPEYQGQGVGFGLKQFQRSWAMEHGYNQISWIFDPLQAGNAKFNLHHLGVTSSVYHVNFYGEMTDGINAGLPSDRLEVMWNLRSPRVKKLVTGKQVLGKVLDLPFLLKCDEQCSPVSDLSDLSFVDQYQRYYIEIPGDLAVLKRSDPKLALDWRFALREVLQVGFGKGYFLVEFFCYLGRYFYELAAPVSWYLYVVECSDGSLYTGVSPDVMRRIVRHNLGRGAVYTASRLPVKLVGIWRFFDRSMALRAEVAFKSQSRHDKLRLVMLRSDFCGASFVHEA